MIQVWNLENKEQLVSNLKVGSHSFYIILLFCNFPFISRFLSFFLFQLLHVDIIIATDMNSGRQGS